MPKLVAIYGRTEAALLRAIAEGSEGPPLWARHSAETGRREDVVYR